MCRLKLMLRVVEPICAAGCDTHNFGSRAEKEHKKKINLFPSVRETKPFNNILFSRFNRHSLSTNGSVSVSVCLLPIFDVRYSMDIVRPMFRFHDRFH